MTVLIDTAPIVAAADRHSPYSSQIQELLRAIREPLIMSAQITAEIDYLLGKRIGNKAKRAFLHDLAAGRFRVECLQPADYSTVAELEAKYPDLRPGIADLSLVVLAERFQTRQILTFDRCHFRAIRPLQGGRFMLLPDDHLLLKSVP